MTSNDDYVLEILQEEGLLSPEQIEAGRETMDGQQGSLLDHLISEETISETDALGTVAGRLGMDMISLADQNLPPQVISLIPPEIAKRYKVVPVFKTDDNLTVAISDPLEFDALDSLRYVLKCNVEGVVATSSEVQGALKRYYAAEDSMEAMLDQIDDGTVDVSVGKGEMADAENDDSDAPIIKLVYLIILEAFRARASDVHLEPMERKFRVRYRVDGVMHEVDSPPKRLQGAILSRVKLMAGMKISDRRVPQDGRIQVNILGRELDLRVSSVPTNRGESIVMRILDKQSLALGLPKLGFFADDQQTFEKLIGLPDGILLVTGPTGSGKTTTLYACLNFINHPDRKIITVEDPVEYHLSGINQVQVREDIGLTFASCLRSILRQAPNIVMIGEIRDLETATIATEASLTGHLVFSTLHTNDAPSAVTRLLDIGIKPFLVASSLRAIIAQRLVRAICEHCKEEYEPTASEMKLLGGSGAQLGESALYHGRGCNKCSLTGYHGRKGLFEVFLIGDEAQRMIYQKVPAAQLRERARELGMRTLREDGLRKISSGMTTIEEVLRVTMGDSN